MWTPKSISDVVNNFTLNAIESDAWDLITRNFVWAGVGDGRKGE